MKYTVEDGRERTETFFTRNVKLIAFFLTVVVVLGIPTVFFLIRDYEAEDTRPEMTVAQLKELAARPAAVGTEELDRYRGTKEERKIDGVTVEVYYYITVEGRYHLDAVKVLVEDREAGSVAGKDTVKDAELAYLSIYDRQTHERLDLLSKKADVDAFFNH